MLISSIENTAKQVVMNKRMEKAFHFLRETDLENLPDGRIEIDQGEIFAIVQSYQTKPIGSPVELEGHRKYIDIQYVVSGSELIGWVDIAKVQVTNQYDEGSDAWLGKVPDNELTMLRLPAKHAAIFYPCDAHAPQLMDGKSALVKKIVIKVSV
jgi:biofilm protein TabA